MERCLYDWRTVFVIFLNSLLLISVIESNDRKVIPVEPGTRGRIKMIEKVHQTRCGAIHYGILEWE